MDILPQLRRLFAYDDWANRAAAASVAAVRPAPERAAGLVAHVVGADHRWISRLLDEAPSMDVWPRIEPAVAPRELDDLRDRWSRLLDRLGPDGLARRITYVNSRGERWTSTTLDVLLHVLLHAAYHRGQVASEVRAAGGAPAVSDFIEATRRGIVS